MAKSKEPKMFAYEAFMEQARKEGRVRNEELSMKVLKPDLSLQARVNHIDAEHVRSLHEILRSGQPLAPIIVFEIQTGEFKIADGFHRHEVYKREWRPSINCVVIKGTSQEAVEYAASCNQKLSLGRKREDVKKAAFMLFDNGWLKFSDTLVAKHVGISPPCIKRWRAEYCEEFGVQSPLMLINENGDLKRKPVRGVPVFDKRIRKDSRTGKLRDHYEARIGSKVYYLGARKKESEIRFNRLLEDFETKYSAFKDPASFVSKVTNRGVCLRNISCENDSVLQYVSGYRTKTSSVVPMAKWDSPAILDASSRAIFIAKHFGLERMIVVVPSILNTLQGIIGLARSLGVEFMTLGVFVEEMNPSSEGQHCQDIA